MTPLQQIAPGQLDHPELPVALESFRLRFLAQGDSWFSFGALPPTRTANLFFRLPLPEACCAVNCAHPGEVMQRMTDTTRHAEFLQLLSGARRRHWDGLLLSGGGNDVIDALQSGPEQPPELRLLARREEWRDTLEGERYLSDAGWETLSRHLRAVFDDLIDARDRRPENRGIPVVLHTYDFATPRDSGAGAGSGPWLFPAVQRYGIPQEDWVKLSRSLLTRLAQLLKSFTLAHANVHVVDTLGTLSPSSTEDTGATEHWTNEIHPSKEGYERLGQVWSRVLTPLYRDRWAVAVESVPAPLMETGDPGPRPMTPSMSPVSPALEVVQGAMPPH